MANKLLATQDSSKVSIKQALNLIRQTLELKTRYNYKYNYQRAKNKDIEVIKGQFKLIRNTITKYRIYKDNIFNFNKTGFIIGIIIIVKVIIASKRYY